MNPAGDVRTNTRKFRLTTQLLLPVIVGILIFSLLPASRGWAKMPRQYDASGVLLMQDAPAKGPPAGSMSQRAVVTASGNPDIDALLSNCFWGGSVVTYSFYDHAEFNGEYYGEEIPGEASDKVKENFRNIFAWLGSQVDIDFVEVVEQYPDTYGKIRVMTFSGSDYAYAYYPYSDLLASQAGDIFLNESYDRLGDTNGFQHDPGKHGFMTLVHELGHAMGLKHPHDGSPTLPLEVDNTAHTAMSYNFVSYSAGSYMTYDVRALQYLYGHQSSLSEDTLYCFTEWADQYCIW